MTDYVACGPSSPSLLRPSYFTVDSNSAAGSSGTYFGGGVKVDSCTVTVGDYSVWQSNTLTGGACCGGAFFGASSTTLSIGDHAVFKSNSAPGDGAGVTGVGACLEKGANSRLAVRCRSPLAPQIRTHSILLLLQPHPPQPSAWTPAPL